MSLLVVACAVVIAFAIEAMTGFGSIVLALSISALVLDINTLIIWLVPLNILMTAPLVWRQRQHIATQFLLTSVLPFMLIGTLAGVFVSEALANDYSKLVFACLICWFAWRSLKQIQAPTHSTVTRTSLILGAGVSHGLFASGGPLLVYATARTGLNKQQFRATMLSVWLTLNSALTLWFLIGGKLVAELENILILVPCVLIGALVGNYFHHKVSQEQFTRIVFTALLLVGVVLFIKSASQLMG